MVRIKGPEYVLSDFGGFRLVERKGSCKLCTIVKRKMGSSGAIYAVVWRREHEFYETGQETDPF